MGHGDGDTLRIPPQLRIRRRKGQRNPSPSHPLTTRRRIPTDGLLQSNYFKGSILVLTYLVIVVGFYVSGYSSDMELMGIDRFDTLALNNPQSFKTIGRPRSGRAY